MITPPYHLLQLYPEFAIEERFYPSQKWVCTKMDVDTAADPLAGLERYDPVYLLHTRRHHEGPTGTMYHLLANYTGGQNEEGEVLVRTQPISVHHWIKKELFGGNIEVQQMCLYLEHKYQGDSAESIPVPLSSSVYVLRRPAMTVFSSTSPGVAVTEQQWDQGRKVMENHLARMGKFHHDREFFTNCYNMPHNHGARRSEIWLQKLSPSTPVIAAVQAEKEDLASLLPLPIQETVVFEEDDEDVQQQAEVVPESDLVINESEG